MTVLSKVPALWRWLQETVTWQDVVVCGAGLGVVYTLFCFTVKPFLSPLRKIPGPGYNPIFGNVREAMIGEAMSSSVRWVQKYGGIVRFYHLLGRERVLIADPEALRHIMVTHVHKYRRITAIDSFLATGIFNVSGEEHTFQRRLMNPFFNHDSVKSYLSVFEEKCDKLIAKWMSKLDPAAKQTAINVQDDLMCMTLDSVGKAVFSYEFGALDDLYLPVYVAFRTITNSLTISFSQVLPFLSKLPTKANRDRQRSQAVIDETIYAIINEKRRQILDAKLAHGKGTETATWDVLGKLMLARDAETGRGFTDSELRDQVLSLMLAGHETTGATMSWLLYLLALHPDVQDKVKQEVTSAMPDRGQPITWEHLDRLEYLTAVIKEGQRLYPVAPSFYRRVAEDDVIMGYKLPRGTMIAYHVGAMMRNPAIWKDPESFLPERFLGDAAQINNSYTHLPFITGPHKCLGHQFAKMQMKLVLSKLVTEFRFAAIPGMKFKRKLAVTLKGTPPITLLVEKITE